MSYIPHVLITAGPTREAIDPVRYISNHSTGKMGVALADEYARRGAQVTLILGPTSIKPSEPLVTTVLVESAAEMYTATAQYFHDASVIIYAAAVADYTPAHPATNKIKKKEATFSLELIKTKDIALELGKQKHEGQTLVGFALETENEVANARTKLDKKNLDLIVLNSLQNEGAGFQHDTNQITIIDKRGKVTNFDLKSKTEVAKDIIDYIEQSKN